MFIFKRWFYNRQPAAVVSTIVAEVQQNKLYENDSDLETKADPTKRDATTTSAKDELMELTEDEDASMPLMELTEDEDVTNPQECTLLNHTILTRIFKLCDVANLKNVRLVCRQWKESSTEHWHKTATVKIISSSHFKQGLTSVKKRSRPKNCSSRQKSSKCHIQDSYDISLLCNKPFEKYKIEEYVFHENFTDSQKLFWSQFGGWMKELLISNSTIYCPKHLQNPWFYAQMPELEKLTIANCTIQGISDTYRTRPPIRSSLHQIYSHLKLRSFKISNVKWSWSWSSSEWGYFFRMFPKLEELIIEGMNASFSTNLFSGINSTYCSNKTLILVHLDVLNIVTPALRRCVLMNNLIQWRFPLQSLAIDIGYETSSDQLKQLLKSVASTLKIFKIFSAPFSEPFTDFPFQVNFPHLKELYMFGFITEGFEFLAFVPNLRILTIDKSCYALKSKLTALLKQWYFMDLFEDFVMMTVNILDTRGSSSFGMMLHLQSLQIDYEFDSLCFSLLKRCMPNLTELKTVLTPITLYDVCQFWPNLCVLELMYGSSVNDDGIKSLANLKYLRKFTYQAYCNKSQLTDACLDDGLLKIDNLEELEICVSERMSNDAINSLKKKIRHVKIFRNFGASHRHDCCSRKKHDLKSLSTPPQHESKEEPVVSTKPTVWAARLRNRNNGRVK